MTWSVVFVNEEVLQELVALPLDMRASFERIVRLIQSFGLEKVHEPYIKHLDARLWEMRLRGQGRNCALDLSHGDGAAHRGAADLRQKDAEDAAAGDRTGAAARAGGDMSRKMIPVEETFAEWRRDPQASPHFYLIIPMQ